MHPDQPVYDNALFPWADDSADNWAADWPDMRAELDRVMLRQHQIPSFQDILDVHLGLQVPAPAERWRVVLFVDFVRPMHAPWKWINEGFIGLGALLLFLRASSTFAALGFRASLPRTLPRSTFAASGITAWAGRTKSMSCTAANGWPSKWAAPIKLPANVSSAS